jgi:hypothetical protein
MSRSQVLEAIYGVDFPREAVLFLRDFVHDAKPLGALWNVHPWELMIPLEEGGPKFPIGPHAIQNELRTYAQAPRLVLLGRIIYPEAPLGHSMIAYDLDELRVGRSTVVGLRNQRDVPETGAQFTVFGPSLIDVFIETIKAYYAGFAHIDRREEAEKRRETEADLANVEALRRELAKDAILP